MSIKTIIKYLMNKNKKFESFITNIRIWNSRIKNKISNNSYLQERKYLQLMTVAKVHDRSFSEYKNKFAGKDIVIIATGPSLNKYKPIENTINIGVNKSVLNEKLKLDIIFMQDWAAVKDYINVFDYKYKDIPKFFGCAPEEYFDFKDKKIIQALIPESIALKYDARRYFQYSTYLSKNIHFSKDIDCNYLECAGSVAFSAIQFALYTNPRKIYIVGCDCTSGHYDDQNGSSLTHLIKPWKELKKFAEIYYPETEIISVNPVGLKGLFTDLYQDEGENGAK